jgi:phosphohistidine phosphatase
MKYLTFIRHAKSDWSNTGQKDIDRPLNSKGLRDTPKMGGKLKEMGFEPEKIFASISMRTRMTAELLVEQLNYNQEVEYCEEIYEASVRSLFDFISLIPNQLNDIAIIGHNPTLTYISEYFSNEVLEHVPTCGVVRIAFDLEEWALLTKGGGKLIYFISPEKSENLED